MNLASVSFLLALPLVAADPWQAPHTQWTNEDARQVLMSSPWAKPAGLSKAIVRWESARTVQLAKDKLTRNLASAVCSSCYAIAVVGIELPPGAAKPEAWLKATGRGAIGSSEVRIQDGAVVFLFPRSEEVEEPIVFRLPAGLKIGNNVVFNGMIGGHKVRTKFSLKSMRYRGKLDL